MSRLWFAFLFIIPLSQPVYSTPITINHLTSDDDGSLDVIVDTLNGVEWLRWDKVAASYSDILYMTTQPDGLYSDFNIATTTEALMFIDALTDSANSCAENTNAICDSGDGFWNFSGLVGDNWEMNNFGFGEDWAWFLSTSTQPGSDVGKLSLSTVISGSYTIALDDVGLTFNEPFCHSDDQGEWCGGPKPNVGWLLYRPISIPEPSPITLFGLGLFGMGIFKKRKTARRH